jgi:hypothetical protein
MLIALVAFNMLVLPIKEMKMALLVLNKKLQSYIIIAQIVALINYGIMKSHEKWILKFGR